MVNYEYYSLTFDGEKIPFEDFTRFEKKAETYLDRFSYGRFKNAAEHLEKIKICLCEMSELIYDHTNRECKEKKSENIDGYSVTYVTEQTDGQDSNAVLASKLYRVAELYLCNTGLLDLGA